MANKKTSDLLILTLCFALFFTFAVTLQIPSIAAELNAENSAVRSMDSAEKIAIASFKKYTHRKVKHFSWCFLYEDDQEWSFSFEDLDVIPGPGSDYFVTINKKSGQATITRGI
jgi:hypothetical protein